MLARLDSRSRERGGEIKQTGCDRHEPDRDWAYALVKWVSCPLSRSPFQRLTISIAQSG